MAALMLADDEFRQRGDSPVSRVTNPKGICPGLFRHPGPRNSKVPHPLLGASAANSYVHAHLRHSPSSFLGEAAASRLPRAYRFSQLVQ